MSTFTLDDLRNLLDATRAGLVSWVLPPDDEGNPVDSAHIFDPVAERENWGGSVQIRAEAFGWRFFLRRSRGLSAIYPNGAPIYERTEEYSLQGYSLEAELGNSRDGKNCWLDAPSRNDIACSDVLADLFQTAVPLAMPWDHRDLPSHDDLLMQLKSDVALAAQAASMPADSQDEPEKDEPTGVMRLG